MEYVFEAHNLTKRFGDLAALDHVDVRISRPSASWARTEAARRHSCST